MEHHDMERFPPTGLRSHGLYSRYLYFDPRWAHFDNPFKPPELWPKNISPIASFVCLSSFQLTIFVWDITFAWSQAFSFYPLLSFWNSSMLLSVFPSPIGLLLYPSPNDSMLTPVAPTSFGLLLNPLSSYGAEKFLS